MFLKIRNGSSWWLFDDIARIHYGGSKDHRIKMSRANQFFMRSDEPIAQTNPIVDPPGSAGGQSIDRRGYVTFAPDITVLEGINHFEGSDDEAQLVNMPWASVRYRNGDECVYVFNKAYVCNDQGRTIEIVA